MLYKFSERNAPFSIKLVNYDLPYLALFKSPWTTSDGLLTRKISKGVFCTFGKIRISPQIVYSSNFIKNSPFQVIFTKVFGHQIISLDELGSVSDRPVTGLQWRLPYCMFNFWNLRSFINYYLQGRMYHEFWTVIELMMADIIYNTGRIYVLWRLTWSERWSENNFTFYSNANIPFELLPSGAWIPGSDIKSLFYLIVKKLCCKRYKQMACIQYVFDSVESIHLIVQTSNRILAKYMNMVSHLK